MGSVDEASHISRIAIIGAGPVGVAFAKYLLAEKVFETIDVFEQRDGVGGVWNISTADRSRHIPVPQTDPWYGSEVQKHETLQDEHIKRSSQGVPDHSLEFESPMYEYLDTNIPKELMRYSDMPFPEEWPLFPSRQDVMRYLEEYANGVRHLIQFRTKVRDVQLDQHALSQERKQWRVTLESIETKETRVGIYDAIVVCNGHYTVPKIPAIDGLEAWNKAYPNTVIHSKAYRIPQVYKDKSVLVIGNSASGTDIAKQIGRHSKKLYLSSRSESMFGQSKPLWREDIDEVINFLPSDQHNRAVRTRSGKLITGLDAVVFATGYFYSFPFLRSLDPPLISDGQRAQGVYQHFLHIEHPEIAIPVLNLKVIPYGLAENQAAVVARLWSGRLPRPSREEMTQWEQKELQKTGNAKHFHFQKFPADGAQMNELYRWAASARHHADLENNGMGKLGMKWDERLVWLRSRFPDLRASFDQRGEEKRQVKRIEDLGFDFAEWRKTAQPDDLKMFVEALCPLVG